MKELIYPEVFLDPFSPTCQELPLMGFLLHSGKKAVRGSPFPEVPENMQEKLERFFVVQNAQRFYQRIALRHWPWMRFYAQLSGGYESRSQSVPKDLAAVHSVAKAYIQVGRALELMASRDQGFCSGYGIEQLKQ